MSGFSGIAGKAVRWSALSQLIRRVGQFILTIILARLLAPADFGVIGMATMVLELAYLLRDLGTGAALIQRQEIDQGLLSTVFWTNMLLGLLAALLIASLAPLAAQFFNQERLTAILRILALMFLFTGSGVVQQALLERKLDFEVLAKIESLSFILGAGAGIACGFGGLGVWSLVVQQLVTHSMLTILLWRSGSWRPSRIFRLSDLTLIRGFSLSLAGSQGLVFINRNVDVILIGRFLGAETLGYYAIAYRVMLTPVHGIAQVVVRALHPVFARLQNNDARMRRAYTRMAGAIAVCTAPLMIGVMAVNQPFVASLLGAKWAPAATLLLILAPVGLLQSVGVTISTIYRAKGRTDGLFRWGLAASVVTILAFAIGLRWGVEGVAWGYFTANLLLLYPAYAIPFGLISLRWRDFGKAIAAPMAAALIMGAVVASLAHAAPQGASPAWLLAALIPAGCVVYLAALRLLNREQVRTIWQIALRRA